MADKDPELMARRLEVFYTAIKRAAEPEIIETYAMKSLDEAEVRLRALEERWAQYNHASEQQAMKEGANLENLDDLLTRTEENFFRASAALGKRIRECKTLHSDEAIHKSISVNVKMPVQQSAIKNTWGEFKGEILKWQSFRDRFKAAIHDNKEITPAFKFSYLKKSLAGDAAKTLGEWQLTDDNYQQAWDRLNEIYDKKYPICRELMRNFVAMPKLLRASPAKLRNMANVTHETVRQLKSQGLPVEHWDFVFVHTLHECLDPETARQWELAREDELPSWQVMVKFIERQADSLPSTIYKEVPPTQELNKNKKETVRLTKQIRADEHKQCEACGRGHPLYRCEEFLGLSLEGRKSFVQKRRLCDNCPKKGHEAEKCYKGPFGRCQGKRHNSVLCPQRQNIADITHVLTERQPNKRPAKRGSMAS